MRRRLAALGVALLLAAVVVALAVRGGDEPSYEFRGETHPIDCGDEGGALFVSQFSRYDGAEPVFDAWYDECGDDWLEATAQDFVDALDP